MVAQAARYPPIDATIEARNPKGLACYSEMGFVDYRTGHGTNCNRFAVKTP